MGLKPKIPMTLMANLPVEDIGVDRYVVLLLDGMLKAHQEILELAKEKAVEHEGCDAGRAEGLQVGDTVMVRKSGKSKPEGRRRFEERVPDEVVRIKEKIGGTHLSIGASGQRSEILLGPECGQVCRREAGEGGSPWIGSRAVESRIGVYYRRRSLDKG